MGQPSLLDPADLPAPLPSNLPEGLRYERGFLAADEERELIALIRTLPFESARYKGWTARRRTRRAAAGRAAPAETRRA
jgi:hypothetical protein